jgi:hypothetical protein
MRMTVELNHPSNTHAVYPPMRVRKKPQAAQGAGAHASSKMVVTLHRISRLPSTGRGKLSYSMATNDGDGISWHHVL